MEFASIIVLALLGEAIWETLKMVWQEGKFSVDRIGAIIISLSLAFGTGLDLFSLIGIPFKIPYLGIAFTGILISRGANWIHDLVKNIIEKLGA